MRSKILISITLFLFSASVAQEVSASNYGDLLKKIVQKEGVLLDRWGGGLKKLLKKTKKDFETSSALDLKGKSEELAFWINAHNFCVLSLLREKWPVTDVMSINGFRDQLQCKIAGADRSLYEIDSGIIRPRFKDPRTRFVLWWGTKGGPPLRAEPFAAKSLEEDLDEQVRASLGGDRLIWTDEESGDLKLSPIFEWYRGDFGKSDEDVLKFLKEHLSEEAAKKLPGKYSEIHFGSFDWHVDVPGKRGKKD